LKRIEINRRDARRLAVNFAGLRGVSETGKRLAKVKRMIDQLGYVQIDTISAIVRAHHHVLYTRIPSYKPDLLGQLMKKREVFEYWAHAASYLPIEDFRYSLRRKRFFREQKDRWPKSDPVLKKKILSRIEKEGALMARQFEDKRIHLGGWSSVKPAKWALERLFNEGELMITERKGFQKVYDLTHRILPANVDQAYPTPAEYAEYLIHRALNLHGVANISEIGYLRSRMKDQIQHSLKIMMERGDVLAVKIKGLDNETYFSYCHSLDRVNERISKKYRFLSPFDPMVIQRNRLAKFFRFDYQLECYVPAAKREYGYFVLPILSGDVFHGRADIKADRQNKRLLVHSLYVEEGRIKSINVDALGDAFAEFAWMNGCESIEIKHCSHSRIASSMKSRISMLM
jgi:uncharacterized protein YcaQ